MPNIITVKNLQQKENSFFKVWNYFLKKKYYYVMLNIDTDFAFYRQNKYERPELFEELKWCDENDITRTKMLSWVRDHTYNGMYVTIFIRFEHIEQFDQFSLTFFGNNSENVKMKLDQSEAKNTIKKMFFVALEELFDF